MSWQLYTSTVVTITPTLNEKRPLGLVNLVHLDRLLHDQAHNCHHNGTYLGSVN